MGGNTRSKANALVTAASLHTSTGLLTATFFSPIQEIMKFCTVSIRNCVMKSHANFNGQLFFHSGDARSCKQVTSASSMRDVEWASSTCTLSFNTFGMEMSCYVT